MSSTAGRAASVLRDGVVYSGSAIVNGVNAITPHFAGAVDILVVRQPDGSLKSTPFYVRFGKYSSFRAKDRTVRILVNGSNTSLAMHLGSYGQAYFVTETTEVYSASEDEVEVDYSEMLSSQSGYSSNEDDAPYATPERLNVVRMDVRRRNEHIMKEQPQKKEEGESAIMEASSWWLAEEDLDKPLEETPFRKARTKPSFRRPVGKARSEGEDLRNEQETENMKGSESMGVEGDLKRNSAQLPTVQSCPSFKTADEADVDEDSGPSSAADKPSHSSGEDAFEESAQFFSLAASPESSAHQNNDGIADHDAEAQQLNLDSKPMTFEGGTERDVTAVFVDDNNGYLGDTETAKVTESLEEPMYSGQEFVGASVLPGFELSLCGHLLKPEMTTSEVQALFVAHRVSQEAFQLKAMAIAHDPQLMCRLPDGIYPWKTALPVILGTLAFGGKWDHLIQDEDGFKTPPSPAAKEHASVGKSSSGWRLWPFGGAASSSKTEVEVESSKKESPSQQQQHLKKKVRIVPKKVLSPTPEQLASLNLMHGQNVISYRLGDNVRQEAYIYVVNWSSRLVISDIDGTVTRSDLLGHLLPPIGVDWTHSGVAHLFSNIKANGYEIMFLSSRAIAQANITRDFLHTLEQEGVRMPVGPVIISPHGLLPSLYREMILRRPHDFKIGCLQDVRSLFPDHWNPFYAGFGNRETDVISYEESGVPPSRIFTINPRGVINRGAFSCVQTSTWSSLQGINELVNEVFPFYTEGQTSESQREEYNEFQHWRTSDFMIFTDDPELSEIARASTTFSRQNSLS